MKRKNEDVCILDNKNKKYKKYDKKRKYEDENLFEKNKKCVIYNNNNYEDDMNIYTIYKIYIR